MDDAVMQALGMKFRLSSNLSMQCEKISKRSYTIRETLSILLRVCVAALG